MSSQRRDSCSIPVRSSRNSQYRDSCAIPARSSSDLGATRATDTRPNCTRPTTSSKEHISSPLITVPDEVHQTSASQYTRHTDLWFHDGSLICRAERTLFKVHMSVLERHSAFFRDMFSMPQPEIGSTDAISNQGLEDDVDKLPIVDLHDAAEDVGNLLTAVYDGPTFGNNDQEDFRVVSGVLRLSTKYLIDFLRAKALAHLTKAWPTSLKDWDAREDLARTHETDLTNGSHLYPHPIAVINLAREVDAPSLLPAAFYDLSRYPFSHIFEPTEEDQTYRPLPPAPSRLSNADLERLCLGKEASQHAITSLIMAMGSSQSVRSAPLNSSHSRKVSHTAVCVSAAACRKDFSELVALATQHYLFDRERGCYDPLYVAEELGQLKSAEFSECKACARSLEAWAAREREKMWKSIPIWFRLDHSGDTSPRLC